MGIDASPPRELCLFDASIEYKKSDTTHFYIKTTQEKRFLCLNRASTDQFDKERNEIHMFFKNTSW